MWRSSRVTAGSNPLDVVFKEVWLRGGIEHKVGPGSEKGSGRVIRVVSHRQVIRHQALGLGGGLGMGRAGKAVPFRGPFDRV